jgi:hypothetical protein
VDQFRRSRGGRGGQVPLLDQQHGKSTARRIAGNPNTIDSTANYQQVEWRLGEFDQKDSLGRHPGIANRSRAGAIIVRSLAPLWDG